MKHWFKVALGLAGVVILVLVAVPFFVSANTFRPVLETQLTTALGRQVKLGDLSLSLLSGSLVANDLSIAGDPQYGADALLTAKQLKVGVEMQPLLFHRQLRVRGFEVVAPEIHLIRSVDGTWNFSSIGHASNSSSSGAPTSLPDLSVGLISIKDGRAVISSLPAQGSARVYEHLNVTINQFSFASQFPFSMSASLPADGKVSLTGTAGPISQQDAAMTPMTAQVSVKHFDPVASGFLDNSAGVQMLADIDAHATSDGAMLRSDGSILADRLVLLKGGAPTPKPVELTFKVSHTLKTNSGEVEDFSIKTGKVAAHVTGTYELPSDAPVVNLKLTGQDLPLDELQALLPSAGVKLPKGSVLKGGSLTTTLTMTGSIKDSVISGPVELDNTSLAGFNLGSKLSGIAMLTGVKMGDITEIKTFRMMVRLTNAGVKTDNLYALLPALGEATGSGTVASDGQLAYQVLVKPQLGGGGQAGTGVLTELTSAVGGAVNSATKQGIPVSISGTVDNPVVTADVKGVLVKDTSSLAQSLLGGNGKNSGAINALSGLFKKK